MRREASTISTEVRHEAATHIFNTIEALPIFTSSQKIAIYASLPDEIPTKDVIEKWSQMGRVILLPRVVDNHTMEFYPYRDQNDLRSGAFGIFEPSATEIVSPCDIDLMILPSVALSPLGARLGRGAGYYDRYLSREGFKAYTIGVALPHQIREDLPVEPHDISLHLVLSAP